MLGMVPDTFAYPCGQQFVGRGAEVRSYIPLVAERFGAGRGWRAEHHNNPQFCDLANLNASDCDVVEFEALLPLVQRAAEEGGWLVFGGHDIGPDPARQTARENTLERLCDYAADPAHGIWLDTVAAVACYVRNQRTAG
jgi:peptidoglycan-N-acetylglucosamine deacetylase